jgi:hypothetical protein
VSKLAHSDDKFMRELEIRAMVKDEPYGLQVQFERLTCSVIGDVEEIAQIDKFYDDLEVGPVELTSINNAITKLRAFVIKHQPRAVA